LSYVYLIRHGQAGTRENYDQLSDIGVEQARLLGEHLAAEGIRFDAAFHGGMRRQLETAREVIDAYARTGLFFPEPAHDPGWREFDLDEVYRGIAPMLCAEDADFARDYAVLMEQVRASRGEGTAEVHRRWSPCDIQIVEAWIRGRFAYDGESWDGFRERVASAVLPANHEGNIIVFTSATPTAVWAGRGLELADERVLRIAGVLYNASITVLRVRGEQVRLFSMNGIPHLTKPEWRTHR
jgi:broad specificity phosphatase PhoE